MMGKRITTASPQYNFSIASLLRKQVLGEIRDLGHKKENSECLKGHIILRSA